ncbi:MAG TPA: Gfo/Idh/MocA family oxidoreductase [Pyrinomonadaceae bacterium]|nr:Gfo/Idh/MocA family oxidoreductase [Pyrinomonadaceae bacterium]
MAKDVVGIGIIGTGFARSTQIPGFRACEGARVVAIASGRKQNAERVAREFGIEFATNDWREVVEREDVDLISIVTPTNTHREMTLAALDAGKAVLCEKPTAIDAEEAAEMLSRSQKTGLLALIDHELRFLPARRRMREMIHSGEIGRVHHAKYCFRAESRVNPERPWNWWSDASQGGGVLGAIGSHAVDSLRWLLKTEVSHVAAQLATHIKERREEESGSMRPVTADDEANLLLRLLDTEATEGATATVSMSVAEQGQPIHSVEVFGSKGALKVEGNAVLLARTGEGRWSEVEAPAGELAEGMRDSEWSRGFTLFSRAVIDALREGRNSVDEAATFTDGYRNQLVLDAARRSSSTGATIEIKD